MNIKWLPEAKNDLSVIKNFIAQDNNLIAEQVIAMLIISVRVLRDNPGVGRPGRVKHTKELVLPSIPYTIPYRIKDGTVEILRVLHQSRKWPSDL